MPETFHCLRSGNWALAEWDDAVESEDVKCPITERHRRGGNRVGHLRVTLPSPRVRDFIATWYSEWMIQDHVLQRFREAGFTGFEVSPVEITKVRRLPKGAGPYEPPRLWELIATGWGGETSPESGIRMTEYCEGCEYSRYSDCLSPSHLINPAAWDGSDFFTVWPLPKFIFVTERVAELIRAERYQGVDLVPFHALTFEDGYAPGPPPWDRGVRRPEAFRGVKTTRFPTRH
jgi:hypothetical protein